MLAIRNNSQRKYINQRDTSRHGTWEKRSRDRDRRGREQSGVPRCVYNPLAPAYTIASIIPQGLRCFLLAIRASRIEEERFSLLRCSPVFNLKHVLRARARAFHVVSSEMKRGSGSIILRHRKERDERDQGDVAPASFGSGVIVNYVRQRGTS